MKLSPKLDPLRGRLALVLLLLGCGPGIERNPLLGDLGGGLPGSGPRPGQPPGPGNPTGSESRYCGWLGSDGVRAIVAMPDGGSFAVGYASGRIAFISLDQAIRLRAFDAHLSPITKLAISPDGAWLASLEEEGTLRLWDARTGERRYEIAQQWIGSLAFSPDGALLVAAGYPDLLLVRVADGTVLWQQSNKLGGLTAYFSADGATVFAGTDSHAAYRVSDGTRLGTVSISPYGGRAVSPDGTQLFAFQSRRSVALLRTQDGAVLWDWPGLNGRLGVEGAAFAPDGTSIAFATRTGPTFVVRASDGEVIRTLEDGARAVAYSPDGRLLAVGLDSGAVDVWDLQTGLARVKQTGSPGHAEQVVQVAVSPDGKLVASVAYGPRDETIKIWRVGDGALLFSSPFPDPRDGDPEAFAFSPDSTVLARTGENDGRLQLLDANTGSLLRTIDPLPPDAPSHERLGADATSIAFSPDGQVLAVTGFPFRGGEQSRVQTYRVSDGAPLPSFKLPLDDIDDATGVAFSPDGTRLATHANHYIKGPSSAALSLYRTSDRALLWTSDRWPGALGGVPRGLPAFSPDGALVATPDPADATRVFAAADGAPVATLPGVRPGGAAFSPDGQRLAVATATALRIYRISDWSLDDEFPGAFRSVAYSPDGATLLAGGADGTVRMVCDTIASP